MTRIRFSPHLAPANTLFNNWVFDLVVVTLTVMLLFGVSLGSRTYSAPSESRYIEIGREMADSGDYATPRLDYVKYFEKPPLFYWVQAGWTKLFGIDPFTARVPTAFFATLLCLITYGLGRMLYGRLAGTLSAFVLATSLYMFALSRVVLVDVPVSVFIAGALTLFLYAAEAPDSRKRTVALYGMYAAAALAVLSKGLIGAVLPGIVVFLWLAFTGRWALLSRLPLASGTLLFLLIAVPWHVLVSLRNPEFPHFYFIHEHVERYLTKVHGRYQPPWFFFVVLVAGLFPWIAFAWPAACEGLRGAWANRRRNATSLFLMIWILFILCFFSLSDSKLIPYILPVFPPIAALLGRYLADAWQERLAPHFRTGFFLTLLMLSLLAVMPSLMLQFTDPTGKIVLTLQQGGDEAWYLSVAAMVSAVILLVTYIQGRARHVVMALVLVAAVIAQFGDRVAAHYNKNSMQALSATILQLDKPGDEVVTYQLYYQDLPLYLKRRISIVAWKGELEFGAAHEDTSAWMMDKPEFWRRWMKDDHLMFLIMRDEQFTELVKTQSPESLHLYGLSQDGHNLLLQNTVPEIPKNRR